MTRFLLPLLLLLHILTPPVCTAQENQNAATWYRRASDRMNSLSQDDWNAINAYLDNPHGNPSSRVREILARSNGILDLVRRGARQIYSDYQHDYSQGFELLLPHLMPLRRSAYLMRLDALVNLHDGNPSAASESISTLSRMGGHLGEDRILISSLVGTALFKTGDTVLQAMLDEGSLSPELALTILENTTTLDSRDPFNYVEAVAMEQEVALATIAKFDNVLEDLNRVTLQTVSDEISPELANYTQENLQQDLESYDATMTHMVEVFAQGDPERGRAALAQLNREIESGEHGLIAKLIMPSLSKVFDQMIESRDLLASRRELLRSIAIGKVNPLAQANAAIWYLRAAERLESRPPADLELLRAYDLDIAPPLNKEITKILKESTDILDIIREASVMRKCDFSFTRLTNFGDQPDAPILAPPYANGLRDLFRLLTLDALHQLRSGEEKPLADRLALGFTMSIHLSSDPIFTSALTAHLGFNQLTSLTTSALDIKLLPEDTKSKLRAIINRMPRRDPFGYIAALIEARSQMTHYYNWVVPEGVTQPELQKRAKTEINTYRPDRLLYLAAILSTMRQDNANQKNPKPAPPLTPLHDLYNLQALQQAQSETPRIAPLLTSGNPEQLTTTLKNQTIPQIAPLHRKTLDARRHLRQTLNLLKPKK